MKLYYESKPGELEHGLLQRKYIEKIPMGNGKFRYFYTQEELDAYYAEQKRASNRQVSMANRRDQAYKKDALNRTVRNVKKNVEKTAANVKEAVLDAAGKRYYDEAREQGDVRNEAYEARRQANKDASSYDKASKKLFSSKKKKTEAANKSADARAEASRQEQIQREAHKKSVELTEKGDKTLYGLIQNIKKKNKKKKK